MADYTYKFEDNEYVIYNGDKKLCNLDNEIISTDNEGLAKKLVDALERGENYTYPGSILCYHYTYCNLRHYSIEEFVKEFSSYMTYDAFLWDIPYVPSRSPCKTSSCYYVYVRYRYVP